MFHSLTCLLCKQLSLSGIQKQSKAFSFALFLNLSFFISHSFKNVGNGAFTNTAVFFALKVQGFDLEPFKFFNRHFIKAFGKDNHIGDFALFKASSLFFIEAQIETGFVCECYAI